MHKSISKTPRNEMSRADDSINVYTAWANIAMSMFFLIVVLIINTYFINISTYIVALSMVIFIIIVEKLECSCRYFIVFGRNSLCLDFPSVDCFLRRDI
jgi:hypothetical protein